MKKAIAISLLLLANIVILAHALVPHHHHDGIVVAILQDACPENAENHHHQHQQGDAPEKCVLNELYIRSEIGSKPICCENCDYGQHLFFDNAININKLNLSDAVGLPFRQKPHIEFYLSQYSSTSNGLRGPPVC